MTNRRIVCAAIRLRNGMIICGVRHMDMIMRLTVASLVPEGSSANVLLRDHKQGFVDNLGGFYDREESYLIAYAAEQCNAKDSQPILYSEDIY